MNDALREQFEEQLAYLPEINQRALKAFDWAEKLLGIGHKYGLHIDELDDLQVETMLAMVGLTPPQNYQNELITRLAISPAEAEKLVNEINKEIFLPIHDYIVSGGPKPESVQTPANPASIMESAGITMTTDESPVALVPTEMVRMGGQQPISQSIPDTRPVSSPLQFHPNAEKSTVPEIPRESDITNPAMQAPINTFQLSKEKLEKMYLDRQKTVDAALGTSEQK
jgi:hypothetical protein